jgi:hypothetical protein
MGGKEVSMDGEVVSFRYQGTQGQCDLEYGATVCDAQEKPRPVQLFEYPELFANLQSTVARRRASLRTAASLMIAFA